jgi:hypothetical protein
MLVGVILCRDGLQEGGLTGGIRQKILAGFIVYVIFQIFITTNLIG